MENADILKNISNVKKITGFADLYRIRIGDYRIGFELENEETIRLIIVSHRKDIYKTFP